MPSDSPYPDIDSTYASSHNTSSSPGRDIQYVVIHYTAGEEQSGSQVCRYFGSTSTPASADYCIGRDGKAWRYNSDINNQFCWHCGDGNGMNGITNENSIGIEVSATPENPDYNEDQIATLAQLVGAIMIEYHLDATQVVRHYDASGKRCPWGYSGSAENDAKWEDLKNRLLSKGGGSTTATALFDHVYDRDDALVKELGYWDMTEAKPTMKTTEYKVSAVNYGGLLQDILTVFGFTTSTSGSGTWSGATGDHPLDVWNYLISKGFTKAGAAAVLGNMNAESGVNPINVENYYEGMLGMNDEQYTEAVDNGSYTNFVYDSAGYGLIQWTYWSRKEKLFNNAKTMNMSIGSIEVQLTTLIEELEGGYNDLYNCLCSTNDVREGTVRFLLEFERPADQSGSVQDKRTEFAMDFYNRFA